ncbi:MAG: endonuclease [Bacilli bacterium]|nr:endonuclease [Bacilli bacterium]
MKLTKKQQKKLLQLIVLLIIVIVGGYFGYDSLFAPENPPANNHYEELPLEEYYEGAEGKTGQDLSSYLTTLSNLNFNGVDYETAKAALADADVDPTDDTKVLTIYSRDSVNRVWDSESWHREHVWPNSRLGVGRISESGINQASDLHNLRAIVPSINSSRSNKVFDNQTSSDTYFPGNQDKGDVARILFYMVIKYPELSLVEPVLANDPETNYTLAGAKMSRFSVILQWHYQDPVDDFERARNEVIYSYQNNRNPFIDHPEFVEMIFENEDYEGLSSTFSPNQEYVFIAIVEREKRWYM